MDYVSNSTIQGCLVKGFQRPVALNFFEDITLKDTKFLGETVNCISVSTGENLKLVNNYIELATTYGITISKTDHVLIQGNRIEEGRNRCINVDNGAFCTIDSNWMAGATESYHLHTYFVTDINVTNNIIPAQAAAPYGMATASGTERSYISGNRIEGDYSGYALNSNVATNPELICKNNFVGTGIVRFNALSGVVTGNIIQSSNVAAESTLLVKTNVGLADN